MDSSAIPIPSPSPAAVPGKSVVTLYNISLALTLIVLVPLAVYNMIGWGQLVVFPGEANFGEGVLVAEALRLSRGESIYTDISQPPYWIATYPPLFQLLISPLAHTGLWWPRVISLLATIIQLGIFIAISRSLTGSRLVGLIACALWINSPCTNAWSAIGRTDTLGRALQSLAIGFSLLASTPRRAWTGAVVFAVLAMLVKQNMFAGGIVAFWILWTRHRRTGITFAVAWVAIVALCYGALELSTNGRFSAHIFLYTSRPVTTGPLLYWLQFFCDTHWPYLVAAIPGCIVAAKQKENRWLIVALAAGLPNAILSGNPGADRNYFFDLLWPLCILIPYGVWNLATSIKLHSARSFRFITVSAMVCTVAWSAYAGWYHFRMTYPGSKDRSRARQVTRNLAKYPGPVLSENVGSAILAGRDPDFTPYIMKAVAESRHWDPTPLIEKIRQRKYSTILLTPLAPVRYPEAVLREIYANYNLIKVMPGNYLIEGATDYLIMRPMQPKAGLPSAVSEALH